GVGVGRQVLTWWREAGAAPQPPQAAVPTLGDASVAHEIAIGNRPWSIVRQAFHGNADAATSALLTACRSAAEGHPAKSLPPPGPGERELLAHLEDAKPRQQGANGTLFYSFAEGIPLVVGTQATAAGPSVAAWGMAVPASPTSWSLYTFRPETSDAANHAILPVPPLPPDCRRLLQVRAVGGDLSMIFTGPPQADQWRAFYDRWAADARLQAVHDWRQSGGVWCVAYESTAPSESTVIRIHLDATDPRSARGVIFVGP
ncbi:MAG: hypothetical protein U1E05_19500, partial [Patescibacteria group bacterium]|nr:hypothetical protein [Patescibacteria group bacterium]